MRLSRLARGIPAAILAVLATVLLFALSGTANAQVVPFFPVTADVLADAHACATNTAPQLIEVSITDQHAWMCAGPRLLQSTPVTTGRLTDGLQTHPGTWTIQAKQTDRTLTGPGYSRFVHFWMPYDGDFGIHDATWQTFPFGGPQWKTQGSAGCVHMPLPVMTWLYHWAQPGTRVTITA